MPEYRLWRRWELSRRFRRETGTKRIGSKGHCGMKRRAQQVLRKLSSCLPLILCLAARKRFRICRGRQLRAAWTAEGCSRRTAREHLANRVCAYLRRFQKGPMERCRSEERRGGKECR